MPGSDGQSQLDKWQRLQHNKLVKLSVLHAVYQTGIYRIYIFLFLYSIGFAIVFPVVPTLITNGFASETAGRHVECQKFPPPQPDFCRNAHAEAVKWTSWTSFFSHSILSFLCAPNIGTLSDRYGRKPFMLVGMSLALLPMCALLLHVGGVIPIRWYYPCSALNGMVSSFSLAITSIADMLHPSHRTAAVGYMSACFSVGILVGPIIGAGLAPISAVCTCIGMIGLSWLFVLLVVPETSPRCRERQRQRKEDCSIRQQQETRERHHFHQQPHKSRLSGALGWARLEPAAAAAALEPAACAAPSTSSSSGSPPRRSGGARDDLEAPLLMHQHEEGGAALAWGQGGDDGGGVREIMWQHSGEGGQVGCGHETQPEAQGGDSSCCLGPGQDTEAAGGGGWERETGRSIAAGGMAKQAGSAACGGSGSGGSGGILHSLEEGKIGKGNILMVGFRLIWHSPFYRRLLLVWIIISMTWEGSQDMLVQYLQLTLGFNTQDQALLLEIMAACGLAIKVLLLATLVRLMGEKRLLMFGLAAYALQDVLLALAPSKALALGAIAMGSFNCVAIPAVMALQSSRCEPANMGAVAGALQGMGALASGIGPVCFSWLFSAVTRTDSSLPYYPAIIWYVAGGIALLGVVVVATLDCSTPVAEGDAEGDTKKAAGTLVAASATEHQA